MLRKTKIVATIGPASTSKEILTKLVTTGINCARLNFSHGKQEEHLKVIKTIRRIAKELNKPVAILQDLAGPKIRIGEVKNNSITLKKDEVLKLTTKKIVGDETRIFVNYRYLTTDLKPGNMVLLADGTIQLEVIKIVANEVVCRILNTGTLSSHKGVNFPGTNLRISAMTDKDCQDLVFGIKSGVDLVAVSFVRTANDVARVKQIIKRHNSNIDVIAKIEKPQAVKEIDSIICISDGIMVARGDLGVETPLEKVPLVQKMLIRKANECAKPVITATQMLRSMVDNPSPTRAEVTDVANAIFDGTDAVMLSEESAAGKYPVESVGYLDRIACEVESVLSYKDLLSVREYYKEESISDAISHSACVLTRDLNAVAIVVPTMSGHTVREVSRYKPQAPILAFSPDDKVVNQLNICFGVQTYKIRQTRTSDEMWELIKTEIRKHNLVKKNSVIVITGGPVSRTVKETNWVRAEIV